MIDLIETYVDHTNSAHLGSIIYLQLVISLFDVITRVDLTFVAMFFSCS